MKTFWFNLSDKIRFLIIGSINAGISFLIYSFFCWILGENYYQASLASAWILSSFISFTLQKFCVFNTEGNILKQYFKCCTTWLISYIINAIVLEILVQIFQLNVYFSQIIATFTCAISTYVLFKNYAFRRNWWVHKFYLILTKTIIKS